MWALLTLPRFHMQTWLFLPPSAPRTGCRHSCGPSFAVICVYILYRKTKVGSCSRDQDQKTIDFPEREGKSLWINGKILFQMATINLPWNNHGCREECKSELIHLGKWKAAENIASTSEKFKNKVISEQKDLKSDQETKIQLCIKEQLIDYRKKFQSTSLTQIEEHLGQNPTNAAPLSLPRAQVQSMVRELISREPKGVAKINKLIN